VSHLQREVYWIILLVMFFIEREVILDTLFFILGEIFKHTQ